MGGIANIGIEKKKLGEGQSKEEQERLNKISVLLDFSDTNLTCYRKIDLTY